MKIAKAHSLRSLHGIFPLWKPPNLPVEEFQDAVRSSIFRSAGIQFKFVADFPLVVGPITNLESEKSSGMVLCGVGLGSKSFPMIHENSTKVYHANFRFIDGHKKVSSFFPKTGNDNSDSEAPRKHKKKKNREKGRFKYNAMRIHIIFKLPTNFNYSACTV